ncbi:MAG TPA: hypothetical protein VFU22_32915 [Roseiflexaceae bacterium]|nr:hypothetical protein [Roseiflexaceae bacterium]
MFLRQLYHDRLAQASYLIGCQATGEAIVIDPNRKSSSISRRRSAPAYASPG